MKRTRRTSPSPLPPDPAVSRRRFMGTLAAAAAAATAATLRPSQPPAEPAPARKKTRWIGHF
jgi:hypothetical protein